MVRDVLVTGGTVFVSRFVAAWMRDRGDHVTVLNRGSREQLPGVDVVLADRNSLGDALSGRSFDAVVDVCAYTGADVRALLDALGGKDEGRIGAYVLVSSSAVYPDTAPQPFSEDTPVGPNAVWGQYGTDKIAAEAELFSRMGRDAWALRPPYLYGPGQNLYREAFAFDCARAGRRFYQPDDGSMPLQFLHVADLCRVIEALLEKRPEPGALNVGMPGHVTIAQWARACYEAVGAPFEVVEVLGDVPQRSYFPFHAYGYELDVARQQELLGGAPMVPLGEGLSEELAWYLAHEGQMRKKPYLEFIDQHLA